MRQLVIAALAATVCVYPAHLVAVRGQTPQGQKDGRGQPSTAGTMQGTGGATATAELKDREGKTVGRARLSDAPHGVLLHVTLEGAPAGEHGFHIHQVGRCDPPAFESAGPHLNPSGAQHGLQNPKGAHAGDLPNIHVPKDGRLTFEVLARGTSLQGQNSMLDNDGAALMMHAKPDDYRSDPAGQAGDRIACGVIQK